MGVGEHSAFSGWRTAVEVSDFKGEIRRADRKGPRARQGESEWAPFSETQQKKIKNRGVIECRREGGRSSD